MKKHIDYLISGIKTNKDLIAYHTSGNGSHGNSEQLIREANISLSHYQDALRNAIECFRGFKLEDYKEHLK